MLFNFAERAIERAAAAFNELPRGIAHALHLIAVFEEMDDFHASIFGIADLNGSTGFEETGSNFGEIFHGFAEDGNLAECGRFQNIVATGSDEGASNENAVGKFVERSELANAVEKENRGVGGNFPRAGIAGEAWAGNGEFRAANKLAVRLVNEGGGSGETFGLARSEDKQSFLEVALRNTIRDEGQWFFGGNDAAGNDDGPAVQAFALGFQPDGERSWGGSSMSYLRLPLTKTFWRERRDRGGARRPARFA